MSTKLPPESRGELDMVERRALAMAEAGLCHLLQRRMDTECFAYILVVRPRSTNSRGMAQAALLQKLQRGIA